MISEPVMIALIGGGSTIGSGLLLELTKRILSRTKDKVEAEEQRNSGLREDLVRKDHENKELRETLDNQEAETDKWRKEFWELYTEYSKLKIRAATALLKSGWSEKEVDELLQDINYDHNVWEKIARNEPPAAKQ